MSSEGLVGWYRIGRRDFLRGLASLAITTGTKSRAEHKPATGWPGYENATIIDFLATPGPFNTVNDTANSLTSEMLRNASSSGITAVNVSVDGDTYEETCKTIAYWEQEIDSHPDALMRIRRFSDIAVAKRNRKLGLIYGFQGTSMIGNDLDRLNTFSSFGVRVIQLTYNRRVIIGDGWLEPANAGLSRFGIDAIERLNTLRAIIDLAHAGQRTTADAIRCSKSPIAISHSGCRALADHPRNQWDQELRAMSDRGGVVGIFLMPFLTIAAQPTADDVIRHLEHAINVCGEDHVGIGSDQSISPISLTNEYRNQHRRFVMERQKLGIAAPGEQADIYFYVPDYNTPMRLELIGQQLSARGHSSTRIEKILGANWLRLIGEVWGQA